MGYHLTGVRKAINNSSNNYKNLQAINAGEGVEKRGPPYTVDRSVNIPWTEKPGGLQSMELKELDSTQ